jgi:CheY-like chemotaxis protein
MSATCVAVDTEMLDRAQDYMQFMGPVMQNMAAENTVVVADDEPLFRQMVVRGVAHFDPKARIFEAGNGQRALEQVARIRKESGSDPLLMVLDLDMPVLDGWTVLETLRTEYEAAGRPCGIPVIVMSSTSGERTFRLFYRKSVHWGRNVYCPLITIAKETCAQKQLYDAVGEQGLFAWLEHFLLY